MLDEAGRNQRRRKLRGFLVAVACLLVVALPLKAIHAAELRIGVFLPATGPNADLGAQMRAGFEEAFKRFRAMDMMLGDEKLTLDVHYYDDESKADVALNAVNRAIAVDHIAVGMGFLSSDIFIRVMTEFQRAHIPVVACCAGSIAVGDAITKQNVSFAFQLSPTSADIVTSTVGAAMAALHPSRIAIVEENTIAGREHGAVARAWLVANAPGTEIVSEDYVPPGTTDFTAQLAKIRRLNPQVILGEVLGPSAAALYQQAYELKISAVIAHHGATASGQSFIDQNAEAMQGSIVNNRWWPAKYSDLSEDMISSYRKTTGSDPTTFSVQAFDTAIVMIEAVKAAKVLAPDAILQALGSGTFTTAWGTRHFTDLANGHRMPIQTVVVQIRDGKKVPIYPLSLAASLGTAFVPK